MRKLLTLSALAMLIAAPVFTQAAEARAQPVDNMQYETEDPRAQAQWEALVAKANEYRLTHEQGKATPDTASVKGVTATDASHGAAITRAPSAELPTTGTAPGASAERNTGNYLGPYPNALAIKQDR